MMNDSSEKPVSAVKVDKKSGTKENELTKKRDKKRKKNS